MRARVESIEGLSAHADLNGLRAWYGELGDNPRRTFIVHGEEEVAEKFVANIADRFGADAVAPERNQSFTLV